MWQPEPPERQSGGAGSGAEHGRPGGARKRRSGRLVASWLLLAVGLGGLAVSAIGIAHQLLPRRFTPSQRRAIAAWEVQRRWRALPAGSIFPGSVPYQISGGVLDGGNALTLAAERLQISPATDCTTAATGRAAAMLLAHGCSAALRATYVDASGGLVATVVVAVLPSASAAHAVWAGLSSAADPAGFLVRPLAVSGSPAAHFGDSQRQVSRAADAGPYVVMATAGFSDGRTTLHISADPYQAAELSSLAAGLIQSAGQTLGHPPPAPRCPGAPGC